MLNPIGWLARLAQLFLTGLILAVGAAIFPRYDAIAANGWAGWSQIGMLLAPAFILLFFLNKRRTRVPALLATLAIMALIVWRLDDVLAFLGV